MTPADREPADPTDAEVLAHVAPPPDERWRQLAAMAPWTTGTWDDDALDELIGHLYALGLVVPFDWNAWFSMDRYPGGRGLADVSPAESVRLITAYVRGDRFTLGVLHGAIVDGSIAAALARVTSRRP